MRGHLLGRHLSRNANRRCSESSVVSRYRLCFLGRSSEMTGHWRLFGFERGVDPRWRGASRIGVDRHRICEVTGGENPPRHCESIVGLGEVEVLGVEDEPARPLVLHKRTRARPTCEPPSARTRDMARR